MFEEDATKIMRTADRATDATQVSPVGRDSFTQHRRKTGYAQVDERIVELEIENLRLQRLVAELLIKNQQLRKPGQTPVAGN
jgi:hypothetical protein